MEQDWKTFRDLPDKGQLISKELFDVIVSTKKTNQNFLRISALASQKRSDQIKAFYITNKGLFNIIV